MKSNINITIDTEALIAAKKRELKLSTLFNDFLLNYLTLPAENPTEDGQEEKMLMALKELLIKKAEAKKEKKVIISG